MAAGAVHATSRDERPKSAGWAIIRVVWGIIRIRVVVISVRAHVRAV